MSVQACAEIVHAGDPDRFAAAMTAPVPDREILFPLYAFNLEVAKAPWMTQEPIIAQMRLQFWRDALDEIEAGATPRAHEVVQPLSEAIHRRDIPLGALRGMIDARLADISREPFTDVSLLWTYLEKGAGGLMVASCAGLGFDTRDPALTLGRAQGLANFITALPDMKAHGWSPVAPEGLSRMAQTALTDIAALKGVDFATATPAARAAWRARGTLTRFLRDPEGPLVESEFARRSSLAWKALRGTW
ncbi:squalene/phytoene synthase family protein [Maritimibacter sp. DP1N21-5]|uniref:phytoene/squalene synthase family protein n=1 Tax=Maritimibacter sp. DP1N21-5 TaxID=2836867 RepID=UPI001C464972|nr:squalene/phytoene synthase family protein [Maritimibacter sp. DP1N21-5]MBV7409974.1 squalene/phytoene synthase family protein [Maritimibacter sp. DP1N21-5]